MRTRHGWWALAWVVACSGAPDSWRDRETRGASVSADAGAGAGGGDGPGGAGGAAGGAGEPGPQAPPVVRDPGDQDAGLERDAGSEQDAGSEPRECKVGEFCPGSEDGCGSLRLETDVHVTASGNLLIVFDQSVSMQGDWQMTTKIAAARDALVGAITPLQDQLTVGALFLPTASCLPRTPAGGAVAPIEASTQIDFMAGVDFLQAWDEHWAMLGDAVGTGTPLNEAFDRAELALQTALTTRDLRGQLGVVVFTDGEPNCVPNPDVTGVPTLPEPERAAAWLTQGIRTYVVGLPGARGVMVLDEIAQSGGTMTYLTPDDPAALEATLTEVVEEQITRTFASCSIALDPAAEFPDQLQLFVEENGTSQEVPRTIGNDPAWTIDKDGSRVELVGQLCADAEAGRFDSFTFEHGCERPPPPPEPEPAPD
jgi:hypothetical protein